MFQSGLIATNITKMLQWLDMFEIGREAVYPGVSVYLYYTHVSKVLYTNLLIPFGLSCSESFCDKRECQFGWDSLMRLLKFYKWRNRKTGKGAKGRTQIR